MTTEPDRRPPTTSDTFAAKVGANASRKLDAQRDPVHVWLGLGMMGVIGWSVAVPTVLGATLGIWLDERHPSSHSWTLALLVCGLVIGCLCAWRWVVKEDESMSEHHDE